MVLSTANDGKYLSKKWQEDRQAALVDRSRFTADELTWLEITSTQGIVIEADDRLYQADTVPLDPLTRRSKYDIRDLPGRK
jgi:hypothetical protein